MPLLIIYELSDYLPVLKKSEMYNVNTNVIFYMIFWFYIKAIKNIFNIKIK